jgi:hypothetical protein
MSHHHIIMVSQKVWAVEVPGCGRPLDGRAPAASAAAAEAAASRSPARGVTAAVATDKLANTHAAVSAGGSSREFTVPWASTEHGSFKREHRVRSSGGRIPYQHTYISWLKKPPHWRQPLITITLHGLSQSSTSPYISYRNQ